MTTTTDLRPTTSTNSTAATDHAASHASRAATENTGPRHAEPTSRYPAPWRTWDWVNVGIAIFLMLAPLFIPGAPVARFLIVGAIVAVAAVWALATASSYASEIATSVAAFITYFAGHFGFFGIAPRWTLWISALAIFAVAMYSLKERQIRS